MEVNMSIESVDLKGSMSKNIQAIMPLEEEKLLFDKNLLEFLENLHAKPFESEEFQKNLLKDFLKKCLPNNFINTNERTDLAIYNVYSPDSTVGILIESKSLNNKNEMISEENYNVKAFQELIHYYLNQRLVHKNIEVKKGIVTNGLEWYIIDSKELEKHFIKNAKLIDLYGKWRAAQLSSANTDFLYKEVIAPFIDNAANNGIKIAHFDLRKSLKQGKKIEIKKNDLTQLFRFFTPENLLNKEIFTDSNKLNKGFYDELLYLMGLEEVKINNKKVIQRLPQNNRQMGSFVENVIDRLEINDVPIEKHYEVATQLTVVWINRILFLKLLESQLVVFNKGDKYKFLTKELLPTFDDIYYLFFGVLAKKVHQRNDEMKEKFPDVPYLNSSLFEETELELSKDGISIDRLREQQVKYYSKTVLKGGNRKRKTGKTDFITYLFDFLDAYDFSTSIRHNKNDKNNLINASVLGLIFEKINGYSDGSFYTPGRITMYMSRNVIRKAVVEKVNEVKGWECKNIQELQFKITSLDIAKEINTIIDRLKICDPAVGSGHFLVSILNELIAVKSELNVLIDSEGRSLNDIRCTVVNDELVVQDFNGDNFTYTRGNPNSERIQKAIFLEKRKLIENSLFGVDINPNSANICRLRLWIELLKSSYYYQEENTNSQQLITLPNIDINIKVGNSLLYKFNIEDSLDKRFAELKEYAELVSAYKVTNEKRKKHDLSEKIAKIKQRFISNIETPEFQRVKRLRRNLAKVGQIDMFASNAEVKKQRIETAEIEKKLKQAISELEYSRENPLFRNGLEWRMEFPEVLDDEGNFSGFDVVIANPPYIYSSDNAFSKSEKKYFEKNYPLSKYQANTFGLFLELSIRILKKNGYNSMIIPNTFLTIGQYNELRRFILGHTGDVFIINSYDKIFEDASVDNCIVNFRKSPSGPVTLAELRNEDVQVIDKVNPEQLLSSSIINISSFSSNGEIDSLEILNKITTNSSRIEDNYATVRVGLEAFEKGKGTPKQPVDDEEFKEMTNSRTFFSNERLGNDYRKFLHGKDINRYKLNWSGEYLKYGKHLAAPRSHKLFEGERILVRRIPAKSDYVIVATLTDGEYVNEQSLTNFFDLKANPKFLLGILNSKVISYWTLHKFDLFQRKTFPQMRAYQMKDFPIPNVLEKEQSVIADLVEKLIELNSLTELTKENITEMKKINIEIDEYTMDLFKFSDEEKQVVREFTIESKIM